MSTKNRQLSLFALTMIAIGATIGSGIFKTPSDIASTVGSSRTIILLWVLGGLVSLVGALIFCEFGSRFAKAGGVYTYLNKAFGPLSGFLYGWSLIAVVSSGTLAALCVVFAEYANYFIGMDQSYEMYLAIAAIVVLTLFNTFSLRSSEWFANISTILKIIGIYALLIITLMLGQELLFAHPVELVDDLGKPKGDNLAGAFVGILWSYTGWHYTSFVSGEAANPRRNIPLAMLFGTLVVTLTYVLCNMGYFKALDHATLSQSSVVAADALEAVKPGFGYLISGLIALSVFGCAGLFVLSTPRVINQMAVDGVFFKTFAKKHPKFGVPVNAIVLQSAWAIVLVFVWGKFSSIIEYVTFIEWLFLLIACAGLYVVRRKYRHEKPSFKAPFYPVLPAIFIAVIGWFIVKNALADKPEYYAGLIVIPIGIVLFLIFRRRQRGTPADNSSNSTAQ